MRWFKHDADARNSLKLRKVRRKYGADGYAIYWFCLEAIAYEVDKDNLTFELKEDAETIGFELSIQEKRVEEIMMYMIEIGLFESSRNTITCLKLAERLDKTMTNSPKMRKWLETKSVMTLDDTGRQLTTLGELDKEVEVEVEVENKKIINHQFDYELVAEIWNRSCDESNTPSKKCRVVSEATKKNMPVTYKKHCAIRRSGGHEPLDRVKFCESYFPAVLNWGSGFVGKPGQHESWKMNLEHASKVGTYDKVAEFLAND